MLTAEPERVGCPWCEATFETDAGGLAMDWLVGHLSREHDIPDAILMGVPVDHA